MIKKKHIRWVFLSTLFLLFFQIPCYAQRFAGKKIFYLDSYHMGYAWSRGIKEGIEAVLKGTGAELKVHSMDTKRNPSERFIKKAAVAARQAIKAYSPDVLIVSDDNAFKYVVKVYYKDVSLPVVFCGLNWDASIYGAPYQNTTGMVEVALIPQLIEKLASYASGPRIGYLSSDNLTSRKEAYYYHNKFGMDIQEVYVDTMQDWQNRFIELQDNVDMLILGNNAGINDWDAPTVRSFVYQQTKVPTGSIYSWMVPYALISYIQVEQEQGEWAATAALAILSGRPPADIPLVTNKKGELILNLVLSETLDILFDPVLLRRGEIFDGRLIGHAVNPQ